MFLLRNSFPSNGAVGLTVHNLLDSLKTTAFPLVTDANQRLSIMSADQRLSRMHFCIPYIGVEPAGKRRHPIGWLCPI